MKITLISTVLLFLCSTILKASECVILIHGLARTDHSFSKMEKKLSESGYLVVNDSYPSTKHDIETLSKDFIPASIKKCSDSETVHFVTHSLGGILVRQYFNTDSLSNLGRVVMLAPPNKGSEITDKLKEDYFYKTINGPAGVELGTDSSSIPNSLGAVSFELGVIAGTRTVNPILSTMLPNPDDGKVSVESTKIEGMSDHIELPVSHTFILRKDEVIEQVIYFLKKGKFES